MAFSATAAATEGFRLIGRKPGAVAIWVIATTVYLAVFGGLFLWLFGDDLAAITALDNVDRAELPGLAARFGAMAGVGVVFYLVGAVILYAAVMRAALGDGDSAFGYLRLGMDEVRLGLASVILLTLFYGAIAIVAGVIVAVAYSDAGLALKVGFGLLFGAAGLCLLIWAAIRICLLWPLVLAEKRIDLGRAWRLTRGRFWPILGMMLLVMVIGWVAQILWEMLVRLTLVFVGGGGLAGLRTPSDVTDLVSANAVVFALLGAAFMVYVVLYIVLTVAPYARAYRDIAGDPEGQAEVFR